VFVQHNDEIVLDLSGPQSARSRVARRYQAGDTLTITEDSNCVMYLHRLRVAGEVPGASEIGWAVLHDFGPNAGQIGENGSS